MLRGFKAVPVWFVLIKQNKNDLGTDFPVTCYIVFASLSPAFHLWGKGC